MRFPRDITRFLLCSLLIVMSGIIVVACQKPAADIVQESKKPEPEIKPTPDLTQICQNLKKEMLAINDQRTTLAIEQVNQDIRMCLPLMKSPEQIQLMHLSKQMYQQFLHIDRSSEQQEAFENYVLDQVTYPTIQQNQFEQLNIRDQYLLRHKGQAYIELVEQADHTIVYRRSPQYLAKVFAPYLTVSDKLFIESLAEQNTQPLFKNNKLNISASEIAKRAKFWQDYAQGAPESHYLADAVFLKNAYSSLLFLGSEDTPIASTFDTASDIDAENWSVIEQLAKNEDGELSIQAKKFIQFINMSPEQRLQNIQLSAKEQSKVENSPQRLALSQINQYLNLTPINLKQPKKDCFSDAICS